MTSWCRIFRVGPVCAHLCVDCKTTNRRTRHKELTAMTYTITLTTEQAAYAQKLIAATTSTGHEPISLQQWLQERVDTATFQRRTAEDDRSRGLRAWTTG